MKFKRTGKTVDGMIEYECEKGHRVIYKLGFSWDEKCPECEGLTDSSIGQVLYNLNKRIEEEVNEG